MKYTSGNVYLTPIGAFMFVGPKDNISLVTLTRYDDPDTLYPEYAKNTHEECLEWLRQYSEDCPMINITSLLKENYGGEIQSW